MVNSELGIYVGIKMKVMSEVNRMSGTNDLTFSRALEKI